MARAIRGFDMIHDGDRIVVALSGGKDSHALLYLLTSLQKRAPVRFSIAVVHVDQGFPGHDPSPLVSYVRQMGLELQVVVDRTYEAVTSKQPDKKPNCSMCARFRRAILYRVCDQLDGTKLALGHHRDDAVTTLMLNLVYAGQLKSMPPKLLADDKKHVVIRPLIYCSEDDIRALSVQLRFPIVPSICCDRMPDQRRKVISNMLASFEKLHPGVRESMLAALANVRASHLLDPRLWTALGLEVACESTLEDTSDSVFGSQIDGSSSIVQNGIVDDGQNRSECVDMNGSDGLDDSSGSNTLKDGV